jgi:hypothetical protein
MRAIVAPVYDTQTVYQTCTNSISDDVLRARLNMVTHRIVLAAQDYDQRAALNNLYSIPPNISRNDDIVVGAVTKKELKAVYSDHMVVRTKPARTIYDQLLATAPLGRCPFCGFGQASTLDHYLPKSKYPLVSVLPLNLVPACKDCNKDKGISIATTAETQCLHPYYDQQHFVNEQWLFALVGATTPANIQFYVNPPIHWDDVSKKRVQAHFNDFKLAGRYSKEASSQLSCLRDTLITYRELLGVDGVKQHLGIEARSSFGQHKNSWQTAMFQALAGCDWYCDGGFNT